MEKMDNKMGNNSDTRDCDHALVVFRRAISNGNVAAYCIPCNSDFLELRESDYVPTGSYYTRFGFNRTGIYKLKNGPGRNGRKLNEHNGNGYDTNHRRTHRGLRDAEVDDTLYRGG